MSCRDAGEWRVRYRKQIILKEIGLVGQERIFEGSALVVGAGGLGGIISMLLVRAGVGTVRIVDADVVVEENLHRQLLFTEEHARLRTPKADAAVEVLRSIDSRTTIEGVVGRVDADSMAAFLHGITVVVDATDNFRTRDIINNACLHFDIPWVHGGVLGTAGMVMTIMPRQGPCLRCLYPVLPDDGPVHSSSTVGILNTIPALVGALQATDALRIILGEYTSTGRLLQLDPWHGEIRTVKIGREPTCPACGEPVGPPKEAS